MKLMYRIQKRKYSSNVIERIKPNTKDTWEVYLCPTVKKVEGDKIVVELFNYLQRN